VILHNSELENAANYIKLKEGTSFGVNGQEDLFILFIYSDAYHRGAV